VRALILVRDSQSDWGAQRVSKLCAGQDGDSVLFIALKDRTMKENKN